MLEWLYPDTEIESSYKIDYEGLFKQGYRGVIFDIDNTLVPHGAGATPEAIELFKRLREIGYKTMAVSNNKEPRVKSFCDVVGSPYIFRAGKPKSKGYRKAMKLMSTDRTNTIFVGDQLFTDVLGAKRAGIRTFLVHPIHPKEEIQIVIKRRFEKIVLYFYHRKLRKAGMQ